MKQFHRARVEISDHPLVLHLYLLKALSILNPLNTLRKLIPTSQTQTTVSLGIIFSFVFLQIKYFPEKINLPAYHKDGPLLHWYFTEALSFKYILDRSSFSPGVYILPLGYCV